MKFTTQLYLKTFFIYAFSFALVMVFWKYLAEVKINLWEQLIQAVLFGTLMSWATVTAQKRALRRLGKKELTEDDLKVSQQESTSTEKTIPEIFDLLKKNKITEKWKLEMKESKIIAKTRVSWSSWGERIIISDLQDYTKIESKPLLKTTMFDKGKNRENVELIKELIDNQ